MICVRCLAQRSGSTSYQAFRLSRRSFQARHGARFFSQTITCHDASQPFTTPPAASKSIRSISTTSTSLAEAEISAKGSSATDGAGGSIALRSSTPAGSVLRGLNYHKDKSDPLAMEDAEYPEWLWSVLDDIRSVGGSKKADSAKGSKKKKKDRRDMTMAAEVIPVHRQTVDLPVSDGTDAGVATALSASAAITKAMRAERRAKIKENNFLRTMG